MPAREEPFDIDQEIILGKRTTPTTIRKEHNRGKVRLRKDAMGWAADVEHDAEDGKGKTGTTFGITEAGFKALVAAEQAALLSRFWPRTAEGTRGL